MLLILVLQPLLKFFVNALYFHQLYVRQILGICLFQLFDTWSQESIIGLIFQQIYLEHLLEGSNDGQKHNWDGNVDHTEITGIPIRINGFYVGDEGIYNLHEVQKSKTSIDTLAYDRLLIFLNKKDYNNWDYY